MSIYTVMVFLRLIVSNTTLQLHSNFLCKVWEKQIDTKDD